MRKLALDDEILMKIEKPARYIGGEVNSVMKDKDEYRCALCHVFSRCHTKLECHIWVYRFCMICLIEEKMPGVNVCILHGRILDAIMREEQIPLFALESQEPDQKF